MGNNTTLFSTIFSFLFSFFLVFAQFEPQVTSGKPCISSYQCWRAEPLNFIGVPEALKGIRNKRLEIGATSGKGGRCRCRNGSCSLFNRVSEIHVPCEEF